MNIIDKTEEIIDKVRFIVPKKSIKSVAIVIIKNEYKSNRELLFNLRSCGMVTTDNVYLARLQGLIDEENSIVEEIKNKKLQ
jgi:hypothetical protein